ncbi:DNA processing protein [Methylomarinovum tepidoasis]|uniref:DNA processing protein n=1 Tax=Methylomarinovum tepidoasis TaxID=2840183 RepID=A0AAU9CCP8_9GAMM|nr:DNA-processing protein DprA [Methylomarinovum sp. IN45]BCX89762.1 DNA processing protein [Methylomarinovum sp. IN45]
MNQDDLHCWLALAQTPGLGGQRITALLHHFSSPAAVFGQPAAVLRELGLPHATVDALLSPRWEQVERSLQWGQQPDCHILPLPDPRYPPQLRTIPSPPPVLFVCGDPALLQRPQIAIVGSRHPTPGGRRNAESFAAELAALGLVVTSGLALGIDAAAHRGALHGGATVAVIGTGPDRVYPARHKQLAGEIASGGAIVSEFPPGTPVRAQHFPRRNRVMAGLALGTLVVEAARHSGSLITARYALEQDREVLAVPGDIHNPQAKGCNALIRDGAHLVETVEDIVTALGLLATSPPIADNPPAVTPGDELSDDYRDLLAKIDYAPTSVDQLVERTGMTPEDLASMLLILELEGHIAAAAGGCYQRIR